MKVSLVSRIALSALAGALAAGPFARADDDKPPDPRELPRKSRETVRGGVPDPAAVRTPLGAMNARGTERFQRPPGRSGTFPFQGPPGFAPVAPAKPPPRARHEKKLAELDKEIADAAKGDPEAVAAFEKGREARVAATADGPKKADAGAEKNPPAPAFLNVPFPARESPFARPARPGRLGVAVEGPSPALVKQLDLPADTGVAVASVLAGSAAEKAGLEPSDVAPKVAAGAAPSEPAAFADLAGELKSGEPFDEAILRTGKK